ncbi:MAG TPA: hypothetical protein VLT33_45855 [Labilithrix sp.]|nr:hypothetical protein [Labilithrix sp.]
MMRLPLVPALLVSILASAVACGSPPEPSSPAEATPATTATAPLPAPPAASAPVTPSSAPATSASAPAKGPQSDLALLDHTGDVCQGAAPPPPPASATAAKVSITQGAVQITGRVNNDVTTALLKAGHDKFAACYAAGLDAKSAGAKAGGKIGGVFVFGTEGKVALSRLDKGATTLEDDAVATCIARAICTMTFPPPSSGIATVAHSMTLSAR